MTTQIFIHGLDGSSQGMKGRFFRERFPRMLVGDYTGSFEDRMAKLKRELIGKNDLILVGSSYGGLMACSFACRAQQRIKRMVLLAPALNHMPEELYRGIRLDFPLILYHGNGDTVVPPGPVRRIARALFSDLTYHLVADDHTLHNTFATIDWDELLEETARPGKANP